MILKNKLVLTLLLFSTTHLFGQFTDTSKVDVIHYTINLDSINISTHYLKADCKIVYKISKLTSQSYFMLKSLIIDSIVSYSGVIKNYLYKSPNLVINYNKSLSVGTNDSFKVYYHGNPVSDPWGGFYFSDADGGYAYNMGIAMNDYPNAYGRVWFPCIDLFSDRATYTVIARTDSNHAAMSGGLLKTKISNADGSLSWIWEISKPVPTDLISIAIGPYTIINKQHKGHPRSYPVTFGARAADTNNLLASFTNIHNALDIFENKYGPYRFDKVGFSMVPFNGGAMEHSENISYPKSTVDGTINYETLWAHELSHSWWGNLVKCYTSDDMWLNEGWASYSENVFLEGLYGRQMYLNNVHDQQKYVLQYAHIIDSSALPLAPIPLKYTYGTHVYKKGSVIVHTLRTYLGDSLFFLACHKYLESMAFKNTTSYQLRDSFSKYTGVNLNEFFDNWVFQPGFPHFEIIKSDFNSNLSEYSITIKQKGRFNSIVYSNVPLKVSFYNELFQRYDYVIKVSRAESLYTIKTPWKASMILLNEDLDITEAISSNLEELTTTGILSLTDAMMDVNVKTLPSKAMIFVEHHWIEPDHNNSNTKGIRFSDYRYWSVDGIFPAGFTAEATIKYNGTKGSVYDGLTYLDHTMNILNEDSLVLLYRTDKQSSWNDITKTNTSFSMINKYDKKGIIKILDLQKGDYCLGIKDYKASQKESSPQNDIKIYPNPVKSELKIEFQNQNKNFKYIRMIDSSGKIIINKRLNNEQSVLINTSGFKKTMYFIEIIGDGMVFTKKVAVE